MFMIENGTVVGGWGDIKYWIKWQPGLCSQVFLDRVGASMLFVRAGDGKPPETGRESVGRNTRQGAAGGAE